MPPPIPSIPSAPRKGVDGKTTYSEGVNVGYRWFDKQNIEPLFAFGHGLSYTTFEYSDLKVAKSSDGGLDVKVDIKNTGSAASDEVPQVYLGAPSQIPDGVQFPVRALVAFDRIHLGAGESKTVNLHVAPRQLQYWSTANHQWAIAAGTRTVSVGGSSRDLRSASADRLGQTRKQQRGAFVEGTPLFCNVVRRIAVARATLWDGFGIDRRRTYQFRTRTPSLRRFDSQIWVYTLPIALRASQL